MPKILPGLPTGAAPAKAAAAPMGIAVEQSSRAQRSRKPADGRGRFDEALSGARKREAGGGAAAAAESPADTKSTHKTDRAAGKKRAEASDRPKRREKPETKADAPVEDAARSEHVDGDAAPAAAGEAAPTNATQPVEAKTGDAAASQAEADSGLLDDGVGEAVAVTGAMPAGLPAIDLQADRDAQVAVAKAGQPQNVEAATTAHATDVPHGPVASLLAEAGLTPPPDASLEQAELAGEATGEATGDTALPALTVAAGRSTNATGAGAARPAEAGGSNAGGASQLQANAIATPAADARPPVEGQPAPELEATQMMNAAGKTEAAKPGADTSAAASTIVAKAAAPVATADMSSPGGANLTPDLTASAPQATAPATAQTASASAPAAALAPEARFAEDNHANIVREMRSQLMPGGGTMRLRLDPPELGPLSVTVRLRNGVMEASFEASSEGAAKLLSHSLGALKTSLESQGVNVERLNVQQVPKDQPAQNDGGRDGQQQRDGERDLQQEQSARQEQQRREMIRRMWRRLSGAQDPLDMVA